MEKESIIDDALDEEVLQNPISSGITSKALDVKKPVIQESLPDNFIDQLQSKKLFCYLLVALFVIMLIILTINNVMQDFIFYSKDSGFPGKHLFFLGTVYTIIVYTYATYVLTTIVDKSYIAFWSWFVFLIAYVFWTINLALRTEYYVKAAPITTNGDFYLIASIIALSLSLLVSFYLKSLVSIVAISTCLIWQLFLLYSWWFKKGTIKI